MVTQLWVVKEASRLGLEVNVFCYGIDHTASCSQLILNQRAGSKVRILADSRTMCEGASTSQGDVQ